MVTTDGDLDYESVDCYADARLFVRDSYVSGSAYVLGFPMT